MGKRIREGCGFFAGGIKLPYGVLPRGNFLQVERWRREKCLQEPCAGCGFRPVHNGNQAALARIRCGAEYLKIPLGCGVDKHAFFSGEFAQGSQITGAGAEVFGHIKDYCARGARQARASLYSEPLKASYRQSFLHLCRAPIRLKAEVVQQSDRAGVENAPKNRVPRREGRIRGPLAGRLLRKENFLGVESGQHGQEILRGVEFGAIELSGANLHPCGVQLAGFVYVERKNVISAAAVELGFLHDGSGGNYAGHGTLYQFACHWRLILLAYGNLLVACENFWKVLVYYVVRYPGHGIILALREGNAQQARAFDGVVVKHLVKVSEPEKKQSVFRQGVFKAPILFHHWSLLIRFFFRFCH